MIDYGTVQDYLFGLKSQGVKFGVDRMRLLAEPLGHPELGRPCLHVAGTNGKGSVAAMLEAILRAAGWRTGLYTSPHLVRLGERIQVDRQPLSEEEIAAYVEELRPIADRLAAVGGEQDRPSFFEWMTAMAFLYFQRRRTDVNVIEVGLGGRLDATNIVQPEVSVITSIGYDHCEILGSTLPEIAREKGGIIKEGRPVVLGRMPAEAEEVLRRLAGERSAPVISVRDEYGEDISRYPVTRLEGDYQRWNAATAALAVRALPTRWRILPAAVETGLGRVDWPGRWQRRQVGEKLLILDASHNPEGASVLDANLEKMVEETGRRPVVITGVLGAARGRSLLPVIARWAAEVHLVIPRQERASGYEELESFLPAGFAGPVHRSTVEELFPSSQVCAAGSAGQPIVVTGSIYVLGEVLARLDPQAGPGEGRLQDW